MQKNNITVLAGALVGGLLASICCILPVLAIVGGISGFSASLSWFAPLRPYLIIMAILSLGFAWWRKFDSDAECNCAVDEKAKFLRSRYFLGVVTIIVAMMVAFPWYSGIFYGGAKKQQVAYAKEKLQVVEFTISGMTCNGCAGRVKRDIENLPGVVTADVSYENKNAVVTFDHAQVKASEIQTVIRSTGYSVTDFKVGIDK